MARAGKAIEDLQNDGVDIAARDRMLIALKDAGFQLRLCEPGELGHSAPGLKTRYKLARAAPLFMPENADDRAARHVRRSQPGRMPRTAVRPLGPWRPEAP